LMAVGWLKVCKAMNVVCKNTSIQEDIFQNKNLVMYEK